MRTFTCNCENTLFFSNSCCLQCGAVVGICPVCRCLGPLEEASDEGAYVCGNPDCGERLKACRNQRDHGVCNCYVAARDQAEELCIFCRLNDVIPDLSEDGNVAKWAKLEDAKRRVLYGAWLAGFPGPAKVATGNPPLQFTFMADTTDEPVSTGHANGLITINLREADDVERERTRIEFGEPQRTLVGHFRHELGHYFWDRLVEPQRLAEFRDLFGDERNPSYVDAQQAYYADGPIGSWQEEYISAYASMHPWEDFAETFGSYLDISAILETANHFGLLAETPSSFEDCMVYHRKIGVFANELNRDIGLLDLVPEVLTAPVMAKLAFVDSLRRPLDPDEDRSAAPSSRPTLPEKG